MSIQFRGYAVVVTVDEYSDSQIPNLGRRVIADGNVVEQVLLNERVCGYSSDRVLRLSGTNATAEKVLDTFDTLRSTLKPEDPLIFYFSGHGHESSCDGSDGASLLPCDANIDLCKNVLTSKILARIWASVPSIRKLAIVDACYSGGIRMTKSKYPTHDVLSKPELSSLSQGEGSVVISSSRAMEQSFIRSLDSTSLFTKHLVHGLLGYGGHDKDGFVRVFDLFNYVAMKVQSEAPQQRPVYAAHHQDQNFPIAYCSDKMCLKEISPIVKRELERNQIQALTELFSQLYPLGPTDLAIWERCGGDLSRLLLNDTGQTRWFRAIRTIVQGGTSITLEMLCQEALQDYPRNQELETALDLSRDGFQDK